MIRRRPRVKVDVIEQSVYIGERNLEAGLRFPDAVEATLVFVERNPLIGKRRPARRRLLAGLRSWPVQGFERHLILYKPIRGGILVFRVLHASRDIDAALLE